LGVCDCPVYGASMDDDGVCACPEGTAEKFDHGYGWCACPEDEEGEYYNEETGECEFYTEETTLLRKKSKLRTLKRGLKREDGKGKGKGGSKLQGRRWET